MPQQVEVIGVGLVEFPDGMSQDEMAAALKQLPKPKAEAPTPTPKKAEPDVATNSPMGEDLGSAIMGEAGEGLGVMNGKVPATPAQIPSKAPYKPEVRAAIEAQYDAASLKQRANMESAPGAMGDVARQRAQEYAKEPEVTRKVSPRVEARAERLIEAGEKPEFAQAAAQRGAEQGVVPGQEVAAIQREGTLDKTDFDFEMQKQYKDANALVRGAMAGYQGFKQGALGVNQAVAELVGADEFARTQGLGAKEARVAVESMGQNPNYVGRMFEGAISSIAQQIPALTAGVVSGSEAIVLGSMIAQSFGQEYAEGRSKGLDGADAATRAGLMASFEGLGEKFGLKFAMDNIRRATSGMKTDQLKEFLGNTLKKELPGEYLTTTGQFLTDLSSVGLNKNATFGDYLKQMADTTVQTLMQSGLMTGGTKAVEKGVGYLQNLTQQQPQPQTQQTQPPAPPVNPAEQTLTQAYAKQGVPPEQAAQEAQQEVAALTTPPAQPTTLQAAQAGLELPVTGGEERVMQRSIPEDEARTTAGRAERAALQMEGTDVSSTEPPSYVTEPSTGEQGTGLLSEPAAGAAGVSTNPIKRGLDAAERLVGAANNREKKQRASLEEQGFVREEGSGGRFTPFHQNIANKLSKAFNFQQYPNLSPVFGVDWQQKTMASDPTPEQFQEAAYAKLEEMDYLGTRPTDTFTPAATPKVETAKPVEEKKETAKPVVYERGAYIPSSTKGADPVASAGMRKLNEDDDLYDAVGPATIISGMDVKGRGEGVGKKLLSSITEWADKNNQRLVLVPAAQPDATTGGLNQEQLKEWYTRNGFEDRADYMVREAKTKEPTSVTETPKAVETKKERPETPAAKPAAPAVEKDTTEALELLAGRNETLETEEEQKALLGINDHLKKWFGTTVDGLLRKRAKGAGPKEKPDTAKTDEEREEQLKDINKLNRNVLTLIKATDKYTPIPEAEQDGSVEQRERGRTGQYPTAAEYDYAEALRLHRLDLMRMALHGLALRSKSRPIKGYSAAADYIRNLKPAERARAKALWEKTIQPTALPVKPKATLTPAQLKRFRAGEKLSKRGRPKKEKTEAVAKTKKEKEAKALAEARENVLGGKKIEFFMSPDAPSMLETTEEEFEAELEGKEDTDTGSSLSLAKLYGSLKDEGFITKEEYEALTEQQDLTEEQQEELFLQQADEREEVPSSKAQQDVEDRTIHDELDADEKKVIAKHYGESTYNEVAQKKFTADVILALNEGLDAVSRVLHDIIKRLQASVLAGIMVMNTSFMTPPMQVAVPTTETRTVRVLAELPTDVEGISDAGKLAYQNILPAIQGELKKNNKLFVLTDKPSATVFIFKPDGSLLLQNKVLLGKTLGDYYVGNTDIEANRITTAGMFNIALRDAARGITERGGDEKKTAGHYDYGKVFVLDKAIEGKYSVTLFHSVWTHEKDAAQRLAALKKAGPADSRYSFGCINVDKTVYGNLLAGYQNQMDGAKMFVVPDNAAATMDFIRGKAVIKGDLVRQSVPEVTKTITERVPPATPRAEERKTPATLRKEQVAFGRRRRAEIEEGGATDLGMEPLAARRNTSTDAFKAWFRDSVVRDEDGEPKVMYHGTAQDIHEFRVPFSTDAGAIFVTDAPGFAENFGYSSEDYMMKELFNTATPEQRNKWIMDAAQLALTRGNIDQEVFDEIKQDYSVMDTSAGFIPAEIETEVHAAIKDTLPSRRNIIPVYVSAQNPFDFENPKHIDILAARLSKPFQRAVLTGDWVGIENATVQDAIKAEGFDGFYVLENGHKNLAVYNPTQIKSVFNKGTYDPTDSRILASQARDKEIAEQQLDMEPDPFFNLLESLGGALAYISSSSNKLESGLALRLLAADNRAALKNVQFVVVEKNDKIIPRDIKKMLNTQVDGYYVPDTKGGTVYVRGLSYGERTQGINNEIVLHEAFHAAGAKKIEYALLAKRLGFSIDKNLSEAVQELEDLMGRAKTTFDAQGDKAHTHLKFLNSADAFTNIQEFYAYGMTDSVMKSFLLNDVPGVNKKTSGFDALINAVLKLFGIDPKLKSGLKDLVLISHEIMQAQQPSSTELANRLTEANTKIRLAAKRQAKSTAAAERDLKASQSPSAIIGQVGIVQSSARNYGPVGAFVENNFTSIKIGTLRGLLNVSPTSTLYKIGIANGITRLEETKQLVRDRGAMRMGIQKEMEAIVERWRKLSRKQLDLLADTMHLSTDLAEDPSLPVQYSGRIGVKSLALRDMWKQLAAVPDGHQLYKDVRDFYKKSAATFIANLKQQIATSRLSGNVNDITTPKGKAFKEIVDTYEAGIGSGPFFPLMRHGDSWARFGKKSNVNFQLAESPNAIKKFINAQIKERKKIGDKRSMEELRAAGEADFGFDVSILRDKLARESTDLRKIFKAIDSAATGASTAFDDLKKEIFQMHLLLLPEQSFRKMFIPRKNRAGYNRDALRNFVNASSRLANQLAGSRYNRRINDSLAAAMSSLEGMKSKEHHELLVNEIKDRVELVMNPQYETTGWDNAVRFANKFTFMYLLTDLRQAANNVWSLPSKGLPTLIKYFGEVATTKELARMMFGEGLVNQVGVRKVNANGTVSWQAPSINLSAWVQNDPERKRAAELMEKLEIAGHGTMTNDVYFASKAQALSLSERILDTTVRVSGALHQGSERAIREILFWSAYNLARKQGAPMPKAVQRAHDIVEEALYRYNPDEMPPWVNKATPRLLLQFKKYPALTTNYYVVNMLEATGAMPSDVRGGAVKAILGAQMMSILGAGLAGAFGVSTMIYLFGVVDGAWDKYADERLKKSLKNMSPLRWFKTDYLPSQFGDMKIPGTDKTLANFLADGALDTLSGSKISGGISEGSLWFDEPPTALDVDAWMSYVGQLVDVNMIAPSSGVVNKIVSGFADWSRGDTRKAIEKWTPIKLLRNLLVAERLKEEGLKDRDFDSIMKSSEFTEGQLFMQQLGFKPQAAAELEEVNYFLATNEKQITQQRNGLVDRWVQNAKRNDFESLAKANKAIRDFNRMYPYDELTIDGNQLVDALDNKLEKSLGKVRGRQVLDKPEFDWLEKYRGEAKLKVIENAP